MRDVRKIGRRTWLARLSGGAVAVWTSLSLSGCGNWSVSIGGGQESVGAVDFRDGIRRVPLGQNGFTTSYIVIRRGEVAIVDTGVSGSGQRIGEALQAAGLGWDAVRNLIVTHHHPDHAGSVGEVLGLATSAKVWAGVADIPSIRSPRPVDAAEDGADVFGLRIIATPGHTLGHVSVYDEAASTFISGDALTNVGGSLAGSAPQYTADMAKAAESVRKIAGLGFEKAFFMHGDPIEKGAAAQIGKLALRLPNDMAVPAEMLGADIDCCGA